MTDVFKPFRLLYAVGKLSLMVRAKPDVPLLILGSMKFAGEQGDNGPTLGIILTGNEALRTRLKREDTQVAEAVDVVRVIISEMPSFLEGLFGPHIVGAGLMVAAQGLEEQSDPSRN